MHHLGVKSSSLLDPSSSSEQDIRSQQQPLCPRPRRLGSALAAPELVLPFRCSLHSQQTGGGDGRTSILSRMTDKGLEGQEIRTCIGCLPPCYAGSPPRRTGNPLVHDVQFVRQMELLSPLARTKLNF